MKSYDWEAVIYDDSVWCVECLPDKVDILTEQELFPIFANSEWDNYPVCCKCGAVHDYVNLTTHGQKQKAKRENTIEKPWGSEYIWARTDYYIGKILKIKAGHKLSLQYHKFKDETIYINKGKIRLHIGRSESDKLVAIILEQGDEYHIPNMVIHRFEALEDSELMGVSTTELEDVVRLEDGYGRVPQIKVETCDSLKDNEFMLTTIKETIKVTNVDFKK